jgi:hypothetical protein
MADQAIPTFNVTAQAVNTSLKSALPFVPQGELSVSQRWGAILVIVSSFTLQP